MALRPMRCYHDIKRQPYTRVSKHKPRKSYVKGVPSSKLHHFETGNAKGDFKLKYAVVAGNPVQIRSNSLESARMMAAKHLAKQLSDNGFFLKILVFPHHVLREKALATGAGADRLSEGMRHSFGRPAGQAARVDAGQRIMMACVPEGKDEIVKEALRRATTKLPGACRIEKVE
jgi:large subunit ribosomal protein L10e